MNKIFCEVTSTEFNLPERLERIVSLSPAITETLYMLGLGDKVVGRSAFDVHPEEVRSKPIVGSYNKVSLQKLKSLDPQVIFLITGYQRSLAMELSKMYPTYVIELPTSVASIIDMVERVGLVAGKIDESRKLASRMVREAASLVNTLRGNVYVEIDLGGPVTFGSRSYITDGLELMGLSNIFGKDEVEWEEPRFEDVLSSDPDYILYEPKMYRWVPRDEVIKALRKRGWGGLTSVAEGKVFVTPPPYDFLAHHGPSFILKAMPWVKSSINGSR